jgi:hypothetical protein
MQFSPDDAYHIVWKLAGSARAEKHAAVLRDLLWRERRCPSLRTHPRARTPPIALVNHSLR